MNLTKNEINKILLPISFCYEDLLNIITQQCNETEDRKSFGGFSSSDSEDKEVVVLYKDRKENDEIIIEELKLEY